MVIGHWWLVGVNHRARSKLGQLKIAIKGFRLSPCHSQSDLAWSRLETFLWPNVFLLVRILTRILVDSCSGNFCLQAVEQENKFHVFVCLCVWCLRVCESVNDRWEWWARESVSGYIVTRLGLQMSGKCWHFWSLVTPIWEGGLTHS